MNNKLNATEIIDALTPKARQIWEVLKPVFNDQLTRDNALKLNTLVSAGGPADRLTYDVARHYVTMRLFDFYEPAHKFLFGEGMLFATFLDNVPTITRVVFRNMHFHEISVALHFYEQRDRDLEDIQTGFTRVWNEITGPGTKHHDLQSQPIDEAVMEAYKRARVALIRCHRREFNLTPIQCFILVDYLKGSTDKLIPYLRPDLRDDCSSGEGVVSTFRDLCPLEKWTGFSESQLDDLIERDQTVEERYGPLLALAQLLNVETSKELYPDAFDFGVKVKEPNAA